MVRVPPITFTRMFEPRHNILSNVRADVRHYVVSWLKHSRESNIGATRTNVLPCAGNADFSFATDEARDSFYAPLGGTQHTHARLSIEPFPSVQ